MVPDCHNDRDEDWISGPASRHLFWNPLMPIVSKCPACHVKYTAPDVYAGKTVTCRRCQQPILVPARSVAPPPIPVATLAPEAPATRPCPFCAEPIRLEARVCRHCGEDLEVRRRPERSRVDASTRTTVYVQAERQPFPHTLHLMLTIVSCGCWLPVWLIAYAMHR